jgi:hypothetical protein
MSGVPLIKSSTMRRFCLVEGFGRRPLSSTDITAGKGVKRTAKCEGDHLGYRLVRPRTASNARPNRSGVSRRTAMSSAVPAPRVSSGGVPEARISVRLSVAVNSSEVPKGAAAHQHAGPEGGHPRRHGRQPVQRAQSARRVRDLRSPSRGERPRHRSPDAPPLPGDALEPMSAFSRPGPTTPPPPSVSNPGEDWCDSRQAVSQPIGRGPTETC